MADENREVEVIAGGQDRKLSCQDVDERTMPLRTDFNQCIQATHSINLAAANAKYSRAEAHALNAAFLSRLKKPGNYCRGDHFAISSEFE